MARPPIPREERADARLEGYVTQEVRDQVDALAETEGLTRAGFVRRAVMVDLTRRSRAAQRLPEHVEDPTVLEHVAALLEASDAGKEAGRG